jgi:hypothetical protein
MTHMPMHIEYNKDDDDDAMKRFAQHSKIYTILK